MKTIIFLFVTFQRKLESIAFYSQKTPAYAGVWCGDRLSMFKKCRRLAALSENMRGEQKNQNGNAMIYVLIAMAMFGFLTMTLSRSNDQADGQDISDEQAELYANELMEYAASAQAAVDMMIISGTTIDELDFTPPSDAAFNTPPNVHKVYHPQGGGLNYQHEFPEALQILPESSWKHSKLSNIEWTPTSALDVSLNAIKIPKEICEIINKKITGNKDIVFLTVPALSRYFQEDGTNEEFNIVNCPDCEGYPSLCVADSTDTFYGFYNIIAAQ